MSSTLVINQIGAARIVVINNPGARNALTQEFLTGLPAALAAADEDPDTAVVVLTGAGNSFCAGGDLNVLRERLSMTLPERRERLEVLNSAVEAIRCSQKPVIAAVEGAAAGAGVSLAFACDMLVAARDAQFSLAYVKVGLTPDGGATHLLSSFLPRQVLTQLCLTGEKITAEQLSRYDAVNELAESGKALERACALSSRIASGPQRAMSRIKRLCQQADETSFETQLACEADFMAISQGDAEAKEGIQAFLDKRPPNFLELREQKITL